MKNLFFYIFISIVIISCGTADKHNKAVEKETIPNSSVEHFQRHIALNGQSNFRDLGNYKTSDKEILKSGMVYRTGTLSKLSDPDVQIIESLNIKTVINFLTEEERAKRGDDRLPEGVQSVYLSIDGTNNEIANLLVARQNGDFSKIPADFNYKIHAMLTEDGKEEYAQLFHLLANADNYPIVFHCSHGVHRTGTAAALILSILGVPWETVREEYLLSNEYRKEEVDKRMADLFSLADENPEINDKEENQKNITAFYILKGEYVDGTKLAIEENYGSFEQYLNSIGVSVYEIEKIKNNILKKPD